MGNQSGTKKQITLFNLISLGVGGAIGSGIFVMMGMGIALTGRSIPLALIGGCIVMMLAYAYNIVLSSIFKLDGGTYEQTAFLCPPLISGTFGIMNFIISMALAMYAVTIVNYLGYIFPGILPYSTPLAITIQTLFFASSIKGSKFMSTIQSIMTVILIASIAVFIIVGLPKVESGYFSGETFFAGNFKGFATAISIMAFACMGTTGPVSLAAEAKNPKKAIPIAILITTIIIAVVYSLMSIVAAGVLPVSEVAGQSLSAVAERVFPRAIYVIFIIGGAVFAIATSLLGGIIGLKYPILATAEDGWLPKVFTKKNKNGFPYVTMGLMYIVAIAPILIGVGLDTLVSYIMIPLMILCGICNALMITIPKKYPLQWKKSFLHMPFPVYAVVIVLSVGCNAFVTYNLFSFLAPNDKIIVAIITAAIFVFAFLRQKMGYVDIEKMNNKKAALIAQAVLEE